MNAQQAKQARSLNELLHANYDAEYGYGQAAENVDDEALQELFREYKQQRNNFGHEIKQCLAIIDAKPDKGTTLTGDAHRSWMNLKAAISSNEEKAILGECIRGEKEALAQYEKVLEHQTLPNDIRLTLDRHRDKIEMALERLKELREAYEIA